MQSLLPVSMIQNNAGSFRNGAFKPSETHQTVRTHESISTTYKPQKSQKINFEDKSYESNAKQLKLSPYQKRFIKFFPDLADKDAFVTEFTVKEHRNEVLLNKLTPDHVKFKRPDFGFNDYMNFNPDEEYEEQRGKGHLWRIFMDCVSSNPKNERVGNYIDFIHQKKIEIMKSKLPSIKTKKNGVSEEEQKHIDLEMLREIESKIGLNQASLDKQKMQTKQNVSKDEQKIYDLKSGLCSIEKDLEAEKEFLKKVQKKAQSNDLKQPFNYVKSKLQVAEKNYNETIEIPSQLKKDRYKDLRAPFGKRPTHADIYKQSDLQLRTRNRVGSSFSKHSSEFSKLSVANRTLQNSFLSITSGKQSNEHLMTISELLSKKLQYVLGLAAFDRNSQEYIYGLQGLKLLNEKRLARIIPYIHLQILINSDLLTSFEIAENSQIILEFTKQFKAPPEKSVKLNREQLHHLHKTSIEQLLKEQHVEAYSKQQKINHILSLRHQQNKTMMSGVNTKLLMQSDQSHIEFSDQKQVKQSTQGMIDDQRNLLISQLDY